MTARKFTHPDNAPEGQEYETDLGYPAEIFATDMGPMRNLILGRVRINGVWRHAVWKSDGTTGRYKGNLRDKPRKIKGWVNVYPGGVGTFLYSTKERANEAANLHRIACIPIEYTEGEGLE